MASVEVNFYFILYSREHGMRDLKIYKAYCGVGKNRGLSADLASWNFKRQWKRMRENQGQKETLIEKS